MEEKKKHTKHANCASKNRTWWNELRRQRNIHLNEIAEATGYARTTVGRFFSGADMPTDEFIEKTCEIFGIDFFEGKLHFDAAYGNRKKEKDDENITAAGDDILRILYGKVDFDTYRAFENSEAESLDKILDEIYGKVDRETFLNINKAIKEASNG